MATTAVLFIKPLNTPVGAIMRSCAPRWVLGWPSNRRAIHCTAPVSFKPAATTYRVAMVITPGLANPANASNGPRMPETSNRANADINTRSADTRVSANVPSTPTSIIRVKTACHSIRSTTPCRGQSPKTFRGTKCPRLFPVISD